MAEEIGGKEIPFLYSDLFRDQTFGYICSMSHCQTENTVAVGEARKEKRAAIRRVFFPEAMQESKVTIVPCLNFIKFNPEGLPVCHGR